MTVARVPGSMRLAVIADVHADWPAQSAVADGIAEAGIDRVARLRRLCAHPYAELVHGR